MTFIMPSLKRAKNGDYLSRKVIPSDVREEYLRLHGKSYEERFRISSLVSPSSAKAQYAEWLAEIEFYMILLQAFHSRVRPPKLSGWNVWQELEAWVNNYAGNLLNIETDILPKNAAAGGYPLVAYCGVGWPRIVIY